MSQQSCNLVSHKYFWLGGLLTYEYANLLFLKKCEVCIDGRYACLQAELS